MLSDAHSRYVIGDDCPLCIVEPYSGGGPDIEQQAPDGDLGGIIFRTTLEPGDRAAFHRRGKPDKSVT